MGDFAYCSRDYAKAAVQDEITRDDAIWRGKLEAASEAIDERCGRTFRIYLAALYYTAEWPDLLLVDDLLSITTLKTDEDEDRAYERTWATTDYDLEPYNAAARKRPYTRLQVSPKGNYSFPQTRKGVELTGKFGFWETLETATTLSAAISTTTATTCTVTSAAGLDVLDTILVSSEQLYITEISGTTLTVVRGVNGTTAATQSNGATVQRYRYPPGIVDAAKLIAARLFDRKNTPLGVMGSTDIGFARLVAETDPDAQVLLRPFERLEVVAA